MCVFHCCSFQNIEVTDRFHLTLLSLFGVYVLMPITFLLYYFIVRFSLSMKIRFAWSSRLFKCLFGIHPRFVTFSIGWLKTFSCRSVLNLFVIEESRAQVYGELTTNFVGDEILAFGRDKNVGQTTHYIFIQVRLSQWLNATVLKRSYLNFLLLIYKQLFLNFKD